MSKSINAVSEQYIKFVAGTIAGAMAKFGQSEASFIGLWEFLNGKGFDHPWLQKKAASRFEVLARLGLVPGLAAAAGCT